MSLAANPEEAAQIANEFVSSIDNIHLEVQFLLGEIKRKDAEVVELEAKIHKKCMDVFGKRGAAGPITVKEQSNIDKAREYLDKIDKLADEKVRLATKLERITIKAVGRLDHDLLRIRKASGMDVSYAEPTVAPSYRPPPVAHTPMYSQPLPTQIVEATATPPAVTSGSAPKRRRLNGTASVLGSFVNNAPVTLTHVTSRTRHPPQVQASTASPAPTRRRDTSRVQPPEEPDGDDDTEEGGKGDEEDNAPYCYCNQPSHGEMIACDGENCQTEWFHLSCLGFKHSPKGEWYCTDCAVTYGVGENGAP
ncbi:hypothetical protein BS47DRAFT_1482313, partial [Hydnum rufescens UP504]